MQLALALPILSLCQSSATPDEIAWVEAHAFPLQTVEAGHGFEDLQPLKALIGEARIVALGECTHGSREVFQMKHRLVEFLASEMGFTIFSIEASTPDEVSDGTKVNAKDYLRRVRDIRRRLVKGREALVAASSEHDFEWALHCAEIVEQGARLNAARYSDGGVRDACMAENVDWILDQNPGARIVLWAHNGHVARQTGTMGSLLAEKFEDDYVVLGFAAREGTYTAMSQGGLRRDNELALPPADGVESVLHQAGLQLFVLDVRSATLADPASAFLATPRPFRSIGALAMDRQFFPTNLREAYDAVLWIEQTTASRAMPE